MIKEQIHARKFRVLNSEKEVLPVDNVQPTLGVVHVLPRLCFIIV